MSEPSNRALVEFRDVSYSVPAAPAPIISRLTLSVFRGETLVLLGESGCGKTTTLKLSQTSKPQPAGIGGRKSTAKGSISYAGERVRDPEAGGPTFTVERSRVSSDMECWKWGRVDNATCRLSWRS